MPNEAPEINRPHALQVRRILVTLLAFFCLERLSRHQLPPVAASGEKDESEIRTQRAVQGK